MLNGLNRHKRILGIAVAAGIFLAIFIPFQSASAYSLSVSGVNSSYAGNNGPSSFSVSLNIKAGEFIPVKQITVQVDGVNIAGYDVNGNQLFGTPNGPVSLGAPSVAMTPYGYSYGYTYGYGYSYGYGYGLIGGYGYGASNAPYLPGFSGPNTVTISGTLNPSLMLPGSHNIQIIINTGAGSGTSSQIYATPITFSITPAGGSSSTGSLIVNAQNGATTLNGMAMDLRQGLTFITTQFTPTTFTLNAGQQYTVYANDFGNNVFSQWSDGVTTRGHLVSLTNGQTQTLTAQYTTGSTPVTLSITSQTTTGAAITGLFNTVIIGNTPLFLSDGSVGNAIGTGFAPDSFQIQPNTQYTAFASDYGRYVFDHWQTSTGTVIPASFNLRGAAVDTASNLNLVAVYKDVGTNLVTIGSTNIPSSITIPQGGALRLDITAIPSGALVLPITIYTGTGATETVTATISGIVGTGSIMIYPESVPSSVPSTVVGSSGTFVLGGALTGSIVLEVDTDAVALSGTIGTITITIPYNHALAVSSGIPEDTSHIQLFHWTGSAWVPLSSLTINTVQYTISGTIVGPSASPIGVGTAPASGSSGSGFVSYGTGGGGGGGSVVLNYNNSTGGSSSNSGSNGGSTSGNTTGATNGILAITINGTQYQIPYSITGGSVTGASANMNGQSLMFNVAATSAGTLTLQIPRSVLDSTGPDGKDSGYQVLLNGVPSTTFSDNSNPTTRTLAINFSPATTQIEVIGTHLAPEFGTIAAIVLLVAIVGIIAATRFRKDGSGLFPSANPLG